MTRRTDTVSTERRSEIMRAVRSCDNKATELALVRIFRLQKISGWRRRIPMTSSPDFVFLRRKLAMFVDGCFWHGCPMHCRMPKGNRAYWTRKIAGNKARDQYVGRTLRRQGWRVVRIWEHELTAGRNQKSEVRRQKVVKRIRTILRQAQDDRRRP